MGVYEDVNNRSLLQMCIHDMTKVDLLLFIISFYFIHCLKPFSCISGDRPSVDGGFKASHDQN